MSYVLLARECLSYLRRCAMHSNELQTKYRKYRERGVTCGNATPSCREGDERARERTGGIKTNARDTTGVTERRTGDTNGETVERAVVKVKRATIKNERSDA